MHGNKVSWKQRLRDGGSKRTENHRNVSSKWVTQRGASPTQDPPPYPPHPFISYLFSRIYSLYPHAQNRISYKCPDPELLQPTYLELWLHSRQRSVQEDENYRYQGLKMLLACLQSCLTMREESRNLGKTHMVASPCPSQLPQTTIRSLLQRMKLGRSISNPCTRGRSFMCLPLKTLVHKWLWAILSPGLLGCVSWGCR